MTELLSISLKTLTKILLSCIEHSILMVYMNPYKNLIIHGKYKIYRHILHIINSFVCFLCIFNIIRQLFIFFIKMSPKNQKKTPKKPAPRSPKIPKDAKIKVIEITPRSFLMPLLIVGLIWAIYSVLMG